MTPVPHAESRRGLGRQAPKIVAALLVLAAGGLFARSKLAPREVTVTPLERGLVVEAVYATGSVEAEDRVIVKAKTAGTIAEVLARDGATVKAGDLLAQIDNPQVTFELQRGEVDLSAARLLAGSAPQIASLAAQAEALGAELVAARKNLARVEELLGRGAVPEAELDVASARVRQLEAQIAALRAQQQAARVDLDANRGRQTAVVETLKARVADTFVRAPMDGVVLSRLVEPGEVVSVGQALFRVGDTRERILEVLIDEADVAKVRDGRDGPASTVAISLYGWPAETFAGRVFEVLPEANRERKAFLTKIRFDAPPPGLRSGMTAEVNVLVGRKEGVLVAPAEAVDEGHAWVADGGRARRRPVRTGARDLLRVEVLEGASEGDLLVVSGQKELAEGARVSVTERPLEKLEAVPDRTQPSLPSP